MLLKEKINRYFEDFETPLGLIINLAIFSLIILSLGMFVAETYPLPYTVKVWFHYFDLVILVLFSLEYVIRFWAAESKSKFFFSFLSFIDLVAILPLLLVGMDTRFLIVLRWFRLLRLFRFFNLQVALFQIYSEDSIILARIFFTLSSIIFIYSGLIYQVEHQANPDNFRHFFDALYFCVVTMTTVGFGDVTPLSEAGRILTLLMIFSGIIVIPGQISDLLKQLLKTTSKVDKLCGECGLAIHERDANYCKICGNTLKKISS